MLAGGSQKYDPEDLREPSIADVVGEGDRAETEPENPTAAGSTAPTTARRAGATTASRSGRSAAT
jgi:hypothetical protein